MCYISHVPSFLHLARSTHLLSLRCSPREPALSPPVPRDSWSSSSRRGSWASRSRASGRATPGLGRIVVLHHRSSASYHIKKFGTCVSEATMRPDPRRPAAHQGDRAEQPGLGPEVWPPSAPYCSLSRRFSLRFDLKAVDTTAVPSYIGNY